MTTHKTEYQYIAYGVRLYAIFNCTNQAINDELKGGYDYV